MTYYKVLSPEGKSIHGGKFQWSLPTQNADGTWTPGDWHSIAAEPVLCERGFHAVTKEHLYDWYECGCAVWRLEGAGAKATTREKVAFQRARLLQPHPHPQWWLDAQAFIDSIADVPFFEPQREPDPEWRMFDTRNEARDAAWADRNAAKDMTRTWGVVASAVRAAARVGVAAAAANAVTAADMNAAGACAGLMTRAIIVKDLIDPSIYEYAQKRWAVWQAGYGLYIDVAGTFYVYRRRD